MQYFTNIFLKLESKARTYFEHSPFIHAFLAGVGMILFWRGVWEVADQIGIHYGWSIFWGILILFAIGLFVHTFVGNEIIIKNIETERKLDQKTEKDVLKVGEEVIGEEVTLKYIAESLKLIESKIEILSKK